jgi:hypothetical protein
MRLWSRYPRGAKQTDERCGSDEAAVTTSVFMRQLAGKVDT